MGGPLKKDWKEGIKLKAVFSDSGPSFGSCSRGVSIGPILSLSVTFYRSGSETAERLRKLGSRTEKKMSLRKKNRPSGAEGQSWVRHPISQLTKTVR